jgi:hypothetical protein
LKSVGLTDNYLLAVDYFIWDELPVEENLSRIHVKKETKKEAKVLVEKIKEIQENEFINNQIRETLRYI